MDASYVSVFANEGNERYGRNPNLLGQWRIKSDSFLFAGNVGAPHQLFGREESIQLGSFCVQINTNYLEAIFVVGRISSFDL